MVTSEGYPILDVDGETIVFPNDVRIDSVTVDTDGTFTYTDAEGVLQDMDVQLDLVQFSNAQGLEAIGKNFYKETVA